ncbi:MAG: alpha/beta hydrolase [Myxococcota bacterium]
MTQYAYDPDFLPALGQIPTVGDYSTAEKIQAMRAIRVDTQQLPPHRSDVARRDRVVPASGSQPAVPIRIYTPSAPANSLRPCVYEIHGGGFMFGTLDMMDPWCESICAALDAVVVSVDYRLAPEHPFPAGVDDCYAGLRWTADHAGELGIDPARLAIAGQSAGGGLAAGLALMARDKGGPAIVYQLLEIPELDDRLDTPSMLAFQDTPFWNRPNAVWSWKHYLGPNHQGTPSIYAAPARATVAQLRGLPPAYVSTMEFDPLRDEGIRYAASMLEAGVSVELHSYAGTFHGSAFVTEAEPSKRNAEEIVAILARRLAARS